MERKDIEHMINLTRRKYNGFSHARDLHFDPVKTFNYFYFYGVEGPDVNLSIVVRAFSEIILPLKHIDFHLSDIAFLCTMFEFGRAIGEDVANGRLMDSGGFSVCNKIYSYLEKNGIYMVNNNIMRLEPRAKDFLRKVESEENSPNVVDMFLTSKINDLERELERVKKERDKYKEELISLNRKKWWQFWK